MSVILITVSSTTSCVSWSAQPAPEKVGKEEGKESRIKKDYASGTTLCPSP
jgi:hypothetical protein